MKAQLVSYDHKWVKVEWCDGAFHDGNKKPQLNITPVMKPLHMAFIWLTSLNMLVPHSSATNVTKKVYKHTQEAYGNEKKLD